MNLHKLLFTKNLCYKRNVEKYDNRFTTFQERGPVGIMVHSTGANNPYLSRYVGPDDGLLGKNRYNNHWNQDMDRLVCVHAFIGKLKDGSVATYQTLPWNFRGWHCSGSGNDTHVSFEICEDDLTDREYFMQAYKEAVELCAYLCKLYNLTEKDICCHCEGYDMGIADNHGDVMNWFPKHGKSMDTLRADVKELLEKPETEPEEKPAPAPDPENTGRYNRLEEIPNYAQLSIKKLMQSGCLIGRTLDGKQLDLSDDMVRIADILVKYIESKGGSEK